MANPLVATRDYLRQSIAELKKVTWPSREITVRYSVLVVALSLALAAFFATLDFGLRQVVNVAFSRAPAAQTVPLPEVTPTLIETENGAEQPSVQVEGETSGETQVPVEGGITLPPITPPTQ